MFGHSVRRGGGGEARKVRFRWRVRISGHRASNFLIKTYEYGTKIHASLGSTIYRSDGMIVDVVDWSVGTRVQLTFDYPPLNYVVFEERGVILHWNSKFNFVQIDIPRCKVKCDKKYFYLLQNFFSYHIIFFLSVLYFYSFRRLRDIEFNPYICSSEKYIMKYLF